jgi:hypothetical protein
MCLWAKPDRLAKLGITVPEIVSAIQSQNSVNPAGQVGSEPIEEWNDGRQSRRRRLRARKAEQRCRCQAGFVLRNIEIGFVKRQRLDEVGVPLQYLAHLSRNSPVARKIRGEFLNGLPWRAQVLADFRQSQAERFADRRNPSA